MEDERIIKKPAVHTGLLHIQPAIPCEQASEMDFYFEMITYTNAVNAPKVSMKTNYLKHISMANYVKR
jgi:hypothetical protein